MPSLIRTHLEDGTVDRGLSVVVILDCTLDRGMDLMTSWLSPLFWVDALEGNLGEETSAESVSATPKFSYGTEFSFFKFLTSLVRTLLSFQPFGGHAPLAKFYFVPFYISYASLLVNPL